METELALKHSRYQSDDLSWGARQQMATHEMAIPYAPVETPQDIARMRARLVRNGISAVMQVRAVGQVEAAFLLSRKMGVSLAQMLIWSQRGIAGPKDWARWERAVDRLAPPASDTADKPFQEMGEKLREARKEQGLTTRQAAGLCGIATSTYNSWEQGRAKANAGKVLRLLSGAS